MFQEKIKQIQDKNQIIDALNTFFKGNGFTVLNQNLLIEQPLLLRLTRLFQKINSFNFN